ncbi:hypothetical protein [Streptomyces sp. NPDC059072]|uniref:hypothetical protein n=1 Tax=Streptomyces sp. NPDC059072 TaxID=3346715 RepID=UPI00367F139B
MRDGEHASWGRDFPVRYLLVQEDLHEEEPSEYWGRCAEVEGLLMDPPPLPREILTLRGCPRESVLGQAVSRTASHARLLGDVEVVIYAGHQGSPRFWLLTDAVVLAHRPTSGGPGRVDIVVGAGVKVEAWWGPHVLPDSPLFELWAESLLPDGPVGGCLAVDGLFEVRPQRAPQPVRLIGCEPGEGLLEHLRGTARELGGGDLVRLWALDRAGRTMTKYDLDFRVLESRPSVLGGSLIDVTLADTGDDRPALAARPVLDVWFDGVPGMRNQWARFGTEGRSAWLELTRIGPYVPPGVARSGGTYHLDGEHATDVPGLLLALGEAILGPGANYGRGPDSVRDYLAGGLSVVPPFTLVWHRADVAREALAGHIVDHDPRRSYFEVLVELLREGGVSVVLEEPGNATQAGSE